MLQQPNDADRGDAAPGSTGPDAAAGEPSKHLMGQPSDQVRAHPRRLLHHLYRHLVKSCRYLHVYLTLFGLALLLFFSVTGFMLNHEDWFLPPYTTQGKIPKELLDQAGEDRVPLIDKLKDDFAIQGEMVSFKAEEGVYHLGFEGSIQVVIQRDGETLVKREENRVTEHIVDGTLPPEMVKPWSDEKRFALVEKLRENFGVKGKAGDFKLDEDKLEVNFKAPGYLAEVTIYNEDGKTRVKHQSTGVAGVMLDLHRKKNSGEEWDYVIDGVSILFVFVSITGLVLWTSLRARAQYGTAVIAVGAGVGLAVYYFYVPR